MTKAVETCLEQHRDRIEIYWLSPVLPEPQLDLAVVGTLEANRLGKRVVRYDGRTDPRLP